MKRSKTIIVMRRAGMLLIAVSALCAQTRKPVANEANADAGSGKISSNAVVRTENMDPFIRKTQILAGSDLKSIRFAGVKRVKVTTQVKLTLDPVFCQNETREPGGSLFCPLVEAVSYEPAYQITYSYDGPPLASDEYAGRRFTFSVFFRPEEDCVAISPFVKPLDNLPLQLNNSRLHLDIFREATSGPFRGFGSKASVYSGLRLIEALNNRLTIQFSFLPLQDGHSTPLTDH